MNFKHFLRSATLLALLAWAGAPAQAQGGVNRLPKAYDPNASVNGVDPGARLMKEVQFDQKLNAQMPMSATFKDENGRSVKLGDYFGKRPVVFAAVYFRCSMLCSEVINSTMRAIRDVPEVVGRDYDIVVLSIDPREGPLQAKAEKKERVAQYESAKWEDRPKAFTHKNSESGWHFLTGTKPNIDVVTKSIGIEYRYDPSNDEYLHPNGIIVATPEGKVSRYFYGFGYEPRDVHLGLIESSNGKISTTPVEKILLTCYHYDPKTGVYTVSAMRVLRLFALLTVFLVVSYVSLSVVREKARRPKTKVGSEPPLSVATK